MDGHGNSALVRTRVPLGEMAEGFPIAFKVYSVAAILFIVFNLGSILASETSAYRGWLELTQPLTDAVAEFVPAAGSATTYMEKRRTRLEQGNHLYWIPAVRNILSIDFELIFFFSLCFIVSISTDLLLNPERAFRNIAAFSTKYGHSPGNFILRLTMYLSLFFVPFYFSISGLMDPHLTSLTGTMIIYFSLLGAGGIAVFALIYFVIPFVAVRFYSGHRDSSAPDRRNRG
jgi:hypothetical protein